MVPGCTLLLSAKSLSRRCLNAASATRWMRFEARRCTASLCIWGGDDFWHMVQNKGSLRKAIAHIKPRHVADKVKERTAARKERAGRKKKRRQEALNKP